MEQIINRGVILGSKKEDYIAGTLPFEIRNQTRDWTSFIPTGEKQWSAKADKMNCVSQSHHNSVEMQITKMIIDNKIPKTHLVWLKTKGYFDANGKINFSEKYSSILNGTTKQGNWLWAVAEDARKTNGLISESMLNSNLDESWDVYYDKNQITPEMMALGKEFLKYFELPYEWTDFSKENLLKQLQHTPIQIVFPGHAIVDILEKQDVLDYFDSYEPWIKESSSRPISAMKIVVNVLIPEVFKHKFSRLIKYGQKNSEVLALQTALQIDGSFPTTLKPTSYYGDITAKAVKSFQYKYNVAPASEIESLGGRTIGPKTRIALNNIFS